MNQKPKDQIKLFKEMANLTDKEVYAVVKKIDKFEKFLFYFVLPFSMLLILNNLYHSYVNDIFNWVFYFNGVALTINIFLLNFVYVAIQRGKPLLAYLKELNDD